MIRPRGKVCACVIVAVVACLACDPPAASQPPRASSSPRTADAATNTPPSAAASPAPAPVASAAPEPTPPQEPRLTVHLVPIGPMPPDTMEQTAKGLEEHAPVRAVIHDRHGFPNRAKSSRAGAYQAHILLDWLDSLSLPRTGKVMGVTEADIVTRKGQHAVWGILGMGSIDGRASVISTHRMRRKWESGGAPEALVRERLWKIAIHELGHTLGLEHCPRVGCIMEDGHGTVKTIDRDTALCDSCASRFETSLRRSASR